MAVSMPVRCGFRSVVDIALPLSLVIVEVEFFRADFLGVTLPDAGGAKRVVLTANALAHFFQVSFKQLRRVGITLLLVRS